MFYDASKIVPDVSQTSHSVLKIEKHSINHNTYKIIPGIKIMWCLVFSTILFNLQGFMDIMLGIYNIKVLMCWVRTK